MQQARRGLGRDRWPCSSFAPINRKLLQILPVASAGSVFQPHVCRRALLAGERGRAESAASLVPFAESSILIKK